jgi:ABC-type hemin transport system ATPase subunit
MAAVGTPSEVMTVDRIREVFRAEVVVDAHPATTTPRVTVLR